MKPLGIQLYSIREYCAEDFIGSLKRVADIGYKGIEFAGLHGHKPEDIAKVVADLGLKIHSSHCKIPTIENIDMIVNQEKALGNSIVIGGFGSKDMKTMDRSVKFLLK